MTQAWALLCCVEGETCALVTHKSQLRWNRLTVEFASKSNVDGNVESGCLFVCAMLRMHGR